MLEHGKVRGSTWLQMWLANSYRRLTPLPFHPKSCVGTAFVLIDCGTLLYEAEEETFL